jgi:hypothetical protein
MHGDYVNFCDVGVFVDMRHSEVQSRYTLFGYANPDHVRPLAAKLVRLVHREDHSEASVRQRAFAQAAGMLIYAIERYGCTFDDIVDIAGYGVATMLAGASPDTRLSGPRRSIELRKTLGQADPDSQAVRLAEILCSSRDLLLRLEDDLDYVLISDIALKAWVADRLGWLDSMHKLRATEALRRYIHQARKTVETIEYLREHVRSKIAARDTPISDPDHPFPSFTNQDEASPLVAYSGDEEIAFAVRSSAELALEALV